MTKHHHEHKQMNSVEQGDAAANVPYWRRAHRDWRFVAVVVLMLIAIVTYVLTGDLTWQVRNPVLPLRVP